MDFFYNCKITQAIDYREGLIIINHWIFMDFQINARQTVQSRVYR